MTRTLSHSAARAFYDRFGARQDRQSWYEEPAIARLLEQARPALARSAIELGCGTGRLASRLLHDHLPPEASYLGLDSSRTMVELARQRTVTFGARCEIRPTSGSLLLTEVADPVATGHRQFDRFFACYVLDLLTAQDIRLAMDQASHLLAPGGLLCLTGLTPGDSLIASMVSRLWSVVQHVRPVLVGGCRPVRLVSYLDRRKWRLRHRSVVTPWQLASEIVVAERL